MTAGHTDPPRGMPTPPRTPTGGAAAYPPRDARPDHPAGPGPDAGGGGGGREPWGPGHPGPGGATADGAEPRRHRGHRRARRDRLRGDDRLRRPGHEAHLPRGRRSSSGEPPRQPCGRRGPALRLGHGAGHAPAAGQHPRPRLQRLPARDRRPSPGLPRARHPPRRARAGQRGSQRRPRPAGPPGAAPHRPRRRGAGAGLQPVGVEAKEGLALLNGTQMMTAVGALAVLDAERLARTASVVAAMSTEALLGTDVAFSAAYHATRPHPGQARVAAELRHLLRDSELQRSHHGVEHKVQDPYSIRCVPQVHGATADALAHARRVLEIEANSATDNPLVFPEGAVAHPTPLPAPRGAPPAPPRRGWPPLRPPGLPRP